MPDSEDRAFEEKETGRLEAFSDGVFAIAITLLILEIKLPRPADAQAGKGLGQALVDQWPAYLAYVSSFLTILIMWVNHHQIMRCLRSADHGLLIVNGLLLMGVTVVPFPTSLVSEYIQHDGATVAAVVYSGLYVLIALLFNALWHYAIRRPGLLAPTAGPRFVRRLTAGYLLGPPVYFAAFVVAFVSPVTSVAVCLALALYFALPTGAVRDD